MIEELFCYPMTGIRSVPNEMCWMHGELVSPDHPLLVGARFFAAIGVA